MPLNSIAYSALLIEFTEPLSLMIEENEEGVYQRCRFGMTAWNYYVSRKFKLQMFAAIKKVVKDMSAKDSDFKLVFNMLLNRKARLFDQYNNVILSVERKIYPDGVSTIYTTSAPYDVVAQTDVSEVVKIILAK